MQPVWLHRWWVLDVVPWWCSGWCWLVERSGRRLGCSSGVEVAFGWAGDERSVGHEQVQMVGVAEHGHAGAVFHVVMV